jgi:hypothetical protein
VAGDPGDLHALIGALIFHQLQLPEWLFKGLMQSLNQQFKNPDAMRFLAVTRPRPEDPGVQTGPA